MAVTFLAGTTGSPYLNADGLTQKYGTAEATISKAGEMRSDGGTRLIEVNIPDLTKLSATQTNPSILDAELFLPKAAFVRRIQIICTTTSTTGSSSLLNLGTVKRDTLTEGDFNGLIDSYDIGTSGAQTAGVEKDLIGGTSGVGVLVGATSGTDAGGYYICASSETAVWTAGALKIRIFYDMNAS